MWLTDNCDWEVGVGVEVLLDEEEEEEEEEGEGEREGRWGNGRPAFEGGDRGAQQNPRKCMPL